MAEIIHIVAEDARARNIKNIREITVVVGDLSNVLADALELAFQYFQKQTPVPITENTELHIIREAAKAQCQSCRLEFEPDYRIALCPSCKGLNCLLIAGETFQVQSYEGSVAFESET
ncbi:MAG: hydrogenase maturation nickel metallochaperone HypA [Lysinibacillus sp.]